MRPPSPKKTTLFCMNNFAELGIQRAILNIVNNWPENKLGKVTLLVHSRVGKLESELNSCVELIELDKYLSIPLVPKSVSRIVAYLFFLRARRFSRIIAVNQFEALALCLVRRFVKMERLIVSEHCHVTSNIIGEDRHRGFFGWYYKTFFASEYRKYVDIVHSVSEDGKLDLVNNFGFRAEHVAVIFNPIDLKKLQNGADESIEHKEDELFLTKPFLFVGRLESQKNLEFLIEVYAQYIREVESLSFCRPLVFCGQGTRYGTLVELVKNLRLEKYVHFLGFRQNPWKYMARSSALVMCSHWEGLPCTIIEAMALGLPVISSNCPTGPRELLLDGEAGILVPPGNKSKFVKALLLVDSENSLLQQKAARATSSLVRFDLENIQQSYATV